MRVVLGVCQKDATEALRLLTWIRDLGSCPNHSLLIVGDANVPWPVGMELLEAGNRAFRSASFITTKESVLGWPKGANALWKRAAEQCSQDNTPFLWLEPDAIPIKFGWADMIQAEYEKCGKPFMVRLYRNTNPQFPSKLISGIAVYPGNALELIGEHADGDSAWDVAAVSEVLPQAFNTPLVQHFWGQENLAPTFAHTKNAGSPINTFTLENIGPETAIFHRNKDGTLIRILRAKLGIKSAQSPFLIVIPACNKDAQLAIKLIRWIDKLGGCPGHECLLSLPTDLVQRYQEPMIKAAREAFEHVSVFRYKCSSTLSWPEGANIAFRNTARYLQGGKTSWLWLEPDAVPLKPDWAQTLQEEYEKCGQLFFGPIVPAMGHMNGCGIYPADTVSLIPNAMSEHLPKNLAWDSVMRDEMIDICHDASNLIQHVWGVVDGKVHPILGDAPSFTSHEQVRAWVNPDAVLFHRVKDGSLIDRLSEMLK
jgi:hypothetical protein